MKLKIKSVNIEIEELFIIIIMISFISLNFYCFIKFFYISYLFILFHELAHIFVASIFNIKLISIKISVCGVCAIIEQKNKKNIINFFVFISGPISNLLLALIFKNEKIIFELNIFLFFLNILPIYPLDGSRIINLLIVNKKIQSVISNLFLYVISIIGIYQIIKYNSFSFIIFSMYLLTFKLLNDKYNKKY